MKSYKELQEHVESIIEESKPVNDVSSSGKKLVSAFDVINHANKLAKAEGSYHDARKTKLKVTREHLQRARSELLGESVEQIDEGGKYGVVALAGAIALGGALGSHFKGNPMMTAPPHVAQAHKAGQALGKVLKKKIDDTVANRSDSAPAPKDQKQKQNSTRGGATPKVYKQTQESTEQIDEALTYQQKLVKLVVRPNGKADPRNLGKVPETGHGLDLSKDEHYNKAMADAHAKGKEHFGDGKYDITHVDQREHKIRGGSVAKVRKQMQESVEQLDEADVYSDMGKFHVTHRGKTVASYKTKHDANNHATALNDQVKKEKDKAILANALRARMTNRGAVSEEFEQLDEGIIDSIKAAFKEWSRNPTQKMLKKGWDTVLYPKHVEPALNRLVIDGKPFKKLVTGAPRVVENNLSTRGLFIQYTIDIVFPIDESEWNGDMIDSLQHELHKLEQSPWNFEISKQLDMKAIQFHPRPMLSYQYKGNSKDLVIHVVVHSPKMGGVLESNTSDKEIIKEVSYKSLKSYVQKANDSKVVSSKTIQDTSASDEDFAKAASKYDKRDRGMNVAKRKIAGKEERRVYESEQLDEASLQSWKKSVADTHGEVEYHKHGNTGGLSNAQTIARNKGGTIVGVFNHSHKNGTVYSKTNESEQLDELSIDTLKSYSQKARENSAELVKQGVKAKRLETSYAKLKKATKRLDSAHTADKKVFKKEWNSKVGITEELDVNNAESVPYKELVKKFQRPQDKESMDLPHGHTLNPTSETHRKQLIKKLKDD